jgi:hypothetical protein
VAADSHVLVRFELPKAKGGPELASATLRLQTLGTHAQAPRLGVFLLDPPLAGTAPQAGLAAGYPGDAGLARDPDVLLAEAFEAGDWTRRWSYVRQSGTFDLVGADASLRFEPLAGKALRVRVEKGSHLGLNAGYRFRDRPGGEPEEIYLRYYLRLADDWKPTRDGGKLPGIAGTYDRGGWGGRKADGTNGWSMRGGFSKVIPQGHPLAGGTALGTYAYHADAKSKYGAFWPWSEGAPGVLRNNRWYCIEQYFKVNDPGSANGVLRVWIDGRLAFDRDGIRVRDVDSIRIEQVWLNVYHGGTGVSPHDQHLFIDNVVIARRYVGPMAER